jgi:hypothetical protein
MEAVALFKSVLVHVNIFITNVMPEKKFLTSRPGLQPGLVDLALSELKTVPKNEICRKKHDQPAQRGEISNPGSQAWDFGPGLTRIIASHRFPGRGLTPA